MSSPITAVSHLKCSHPHCEACLETAIVLVVRTQTHVLNDMWAIDPPHTRCVSAHSERAVAHVLASAQNHSAWLADAAPIALLISGLIRNYDRGAVNLDNRLSELSRSVQRVHSFVSFGLERELEPGLEHTKDATLMPSAALQRVLSRWTVAWRLASMRTARESPCDGLPPASNGLTCTSNDSVGLYKAQQVWPQVASFPVACRCTPDALQIRVAAARVTDSVTASQNATNPLSRGNPRPHRCNAAWLLCQSRQAVFSLRLAQVLASVRPAYASVRDGASV